MRILLILGSLIFSLYGGSVKAYLKQANVEKGENAELVIDVRGKHITMPAITSIGGYSTQTYNQAYRVNRNGKIEEQQKITYVFFPEQNTTIPSYEVGVDGKTYHTKALKVNVKPSATSKYFQFYIKLDQDEVYVGQSVEMRFIFKRDMRQMLRDMNFIPPKMDKLWLEKSGQLKDKTEGNIQTQVLTYKVTPQSAGDFVLDKSFVELVMIEDRVGDFGFIMEQNKFKRVYANPVTLKVLPLPDGIEVAGVFDVNISVDKNTLKQGEAVNLSIVIKGKGNIVDIKPFEMEIDGVNVIEDKPIVDKKTGVFVQKIAFVGDKDFTIPPIAFDYFDALKKERVNTLSSAFHIHVKSVQKTSTPQLQTNTAEVRKSPEQTSWIYVLVGVLGGALIGFVLGRVKSFGKKEEKPLEKRIKKATGKALLDILLPYVGKNTDLDNVIYRLEENVFKHTAHEIDKKWIIKELDKDI